MARTQHIQNPHSVYKVPAGGLPVENLLYFDGNHWKDSGPVVLIPGSVIVWDAEFVGESVK